MRERESQGRTKTLHYKMFFHTFRIQF
uniref:Rps3, OrsajM_p18 n=1 Tax=Arundo donax TaxID=35708 RepID=A0A0A8YGA7_ARUDO